jgi:alginate O-acetyltransferase complex protein AlgI
MVFSSPIFVFLFLPLALAAHFAAPRRLRNVALFAVSLLFYAWGEKGFVFLMLASIALNYGLGRWLEARNSRSVLALGVILNLALLVVYKYANFFIANLNTILPQPIVHKPIHLPIGISFFTFEAIAYLVDIRRRDTTAQRNPANFGLFMTLFPHLIAGPVVRYRDLAAAIANRTLTSALFASGVRRFVVGLAKKVLVANALGLTADKLFALPPDQLAPSAAWLGVVCYTLHIYFDFSGYSDMAIGLGRMFGFELCENFRYPYAAESVTDFWRRWHISLSTWFRDYLYIPLGGNRRGPWRTCFNLCVVFALCGLWHGASWTFLAWGLFHGLFLAMERAGLGRLLGKIPFPLRHGYTLLAVMAGWVFFKAETLGQALGYLGAMAGLSAGPHVVADYVSRELLLVLLFGSVACLPVWPLLRGWWGRSREFFGAPGAAAVELGRVAATAAMLAATTVQLTAGTYNPFIYFRF